MKSIAPWDDERATLILKNVRAALHGVRNGRVILLEGVMQGGNEPDFAKILDLEMMMFPGGGERTAEEFSRLFANTGFVLSRIVPTESAVCVIEAASACGTASR